MRPTGQILPHIATRQLLDDFFGRIGWSQENEAQFLKAFVLTSFSRKHYMLYPKIYATSTTDDLTLLSDYNICACVKWSCQYKGSDWTVMAEHYWTLLHSWNTKMNTNLGIKGWRSNSSITP